MLVHRVGKADESFEPVRIEVLLPEHRSIPDVLVHVEDGMELPAARSHRKVIAVDRYGEAAFAVHEANDPTRIERRARCGFLLIVPTRRIVTDHRPTLRRGCDSQGS